MARSVSIGGAKRLLLLASAVVAFLAMPAAASTARSPSPHTLYEALLANGIPKSELPAGFRSSSTRKRAFEGSAKTHHAVGEVEVNLAGAANAFIVYVIFPTRTAALDYFTDGLKDIKGQKGVRVQLNTVRGLPKPSAILKAQGVTQVTCFAKNVTINAISTRSYADALSVAQLALRHLNAVR